MGVFDQYIATRRLQNAPAGNPMGNVANISPQMMALMPNLLKGIAADTVGSLSDIASMPLAAYASGFSMGNGQYPGKVMSNIPGATDWLGEKMGADVNSPAFIAGSSLSPDVQDLSVVGAKMAANYPALNAVLAGMTAWHGGPHKFDKFDMSKIGTGEGAQAYGHGLYFAENPEVAGQYRKVLSGPDRTILSGADILSKGDDLAEVTGFSKPDIQRAAEILDEFGGDYGQAQGSLAQALLNGYQQNDRGAFNVLRSLSPSAKVEKGGHLYEVDIPDEAIAKMLDWDKPLYEQSSVIDKVVPGFSAKGERYKAISARMDKLVMSGQLDTPEWNALKDEALSIREGLGFAPNDSGADFYRAFRELPEDASWKLNQAGIPGIRYLDGSSRSAGEGTRNFVVFDDTIPKVVSRNGEKLK